MKIRYCFRASPLALNSDFALAPPFPPLTEMRQKLASVLQARVRVVLETWCRMLTHRSYKS